MGEDGGGSSRLKGLAKLGLKRPPKSWLDKVKGFVGHSVRSSLEDRSGGVWEVGLLGNPAELGKPAKL